MKRNIRKQMMFGVIWHLPGERIHHWIGECGACVCEKIWTLLATNMLGDAHDALNRLTDKPGS